MVTNSVNSQRNNPYVNINKTKYSVVCYHISAKICRINSDRKTDISSLKSLTFSASNTPHQQLLHAPPATPPRPTSNTSTSPTCNNHKDSNDTTVGHYSYNSLHRYPSLGLLNVQPSMAMAAPLSTPPSPTPPPLCR